MTDWDSQAESYSRVRESRRETVFTHVRDKLVADEVETLLDFGGGDGQFSAFCASSIRHVVSYDPAPHMTALARAVCAGHANVDVVATSQSLRDGSFDAVTLNAVWMCLPTEAECLTCLLEVKRLLRPGGQMVASVTHPCFRDRHFGTYWTDFEMGDYLRDGSRFNVTIDDGQSRFVIRDTHWSLGAMARQVKLAGMVLVDLCELPDAPAEGRNMGLGSPWLVITTQRC